MSFKRALRIGYKVSLPLALLLTSAMAYDAFWNNHEWMVTLLIMASIFLLLLVTFLFLGPARRLPFGHEQDMMVAREDDPDTISYGGT